MELWGGTVACTSVPICIQGRLMGLNSAGTWLDAAGRPDYVNVKRSYDRSFVSGMDFRVLFLTLLRYQLGYKMAGYVCRWNTLETYRTGSSNALITFRLTQALSGHALWTAWFYFFGTESLATGFEEFGRVLFGLASASWVATGWIVFVIWSDGAM